MTYNKYMKSIFLLLSFLSINLSFAQNDYATIYIYRPSAFTIGSQDVRIQINDIPICNLKNGSALEYKVFNKSKRFLKYKVSKYSIKLNIYKSSSTNLKDLWTRNNSRLIYPFSNITYDTGNWNYIKSI